MFHTRPKMNIAWILCETCMKLNAHFIHKKTSSDCCIGKSEMFKLFTLFNGM